MQLERSEHKDERRIWNGLVFNITLILAVVINGIFLGIFIRNRSLIEEELKTRARSHFQNIVLTREWSAGYGGVYVEKKHGVVSNPYLDNPDIHTTDGKTYTKKNPALITREISALAEHKGHFRFNITSINPLNPDNQPDAFEKQALLQFEAGKTELIRQEETKKGTFYRYMAPLATERTCLQCHAKQGYKEGDVRGGISIQFDISSTKQKLATNLFVIIGLAFATLAILFGLIYSLVSRVKRLIARANEQIRKLATTDDLTGLYNRRHFYERFEEELGRAKRYKHNLCCIMLDVDHFKKVNDTHGHQTGDLVLRAVSKLLQSACRQSDVVARYGGEEFICLLAETSQNGALILAERIRTDVETLPVETSSGQPVDVSVCAGVASLSPEDLEKISNPDDVIKIADLALYQAKENGRNQVVLGELPRLNPDVNAPATEKRSQGLRATVKRALLMSRKASRGHFFTPHVAADKLRFFAFSTHKCEEVSSN